MTYLRRKSEYDKARLTTGSPFGIKPPDTYYSNETALFHLREYDVSLACFSSFFICFMILFLSNHLSEIRTLNANHGQWLIGINRI